LRGVIHDWPDAYARKILKHLRASAQSDTKLILNEFLVPYAADINNLFSDIPGADVPSAPYPLLANLGPVSNSTVLTDLQVYTASFRTLRAPAVWQSLMQLFADDGYRQRTGTYDWAVY
jgi:hypothetical protein